MNVSRAPADDAAPFQARMRTPFATLGIATDGRAITRVEYLAPSEPGQAPADAVAERAVREVERYLDDPAWRFTVPLVPRGTPFRRRVWEAISAIRAGESRTYGELAQRLVTAPRAVGQACGANPISLIIPCHRVVGRLGALGGFMGTAGSFAPRSADDLFVTAATPEPAIGRSRRIAPVDPVEPDALLPSAIKRWLLVHEGYRFGR
ncbi:Methylated-DNA--protein-cysteine methyltransferase [Burkholderiales bacterium]|nr:Methylated-DNA--protein-cysteine methyltransferase [Burkholderiales bacterium]